MAKYKCNVCGYVFDEEEQGIPFSELKEWIYPLIYIGNQTAGITRQHKWI